MIAPRAGICPNQGILRCRMSFHEALAFQISRAPETLDEAVASLAADPSAKVLAGGASLMPVLAFRLAAPSLLVDLRRLPGVIRSARRRGRAMSVGWSGSADERCSS